MSVIDYQREIHKKKQSDVMRYMQRIRVCEYRQMGDCCPLERPSCLVKARTLGYKAKPGFHIVMARVAKGDAVRRQYNNGNTRGKCVNAGIHQIKPAKGKQASAELLAGKTFQDLSVFGSYWVGADACHHYYEVIMVDTKCDSIRNDPRINFMCKAHMKRRECRGLTAATKKSRGLGKGMKYNNTVGGSRKAAWRKGNTISLLRYR